MLPNIGCVTSHSSVPHCYRHQLMNSDVLLLLVLRLYLPLRGCRVLPLLESSTVQLFHQSGHAGRLECMSSQDCW
jgi:hypothetical protein